MASHPCLYTSIPLAAPAHVHTPRQSNKTCINILLLFSSVGPAACKHVPDLYSQSHSQPSGFSIIFGQMGCQCGPAVREATALICAAARVSACWLFTVGRCVWDWMQLLEVCCNLKPSLKQWNRLYVITDISGAHLMGPPWARSPMFHSDMGLHLQSSSYSQMWNKRKTDILSRLNETTAARFVFSYIHTK